MNSFGKPSQQISEIPTAVHFITGASTSETAFVDVFARGPLNQAVRITSVTEFNESFGGLDARSEASYGISQYFQNGGQVAWVVRVLAPGSEPGSTAWIQSEGERALLGDGSPTAGIYTLAGTSFNILCVPCAANLSSASIMSFYSSAARFCERQLAFLVIDTAQDQKDTSPSEVQKWVKDFGPEKNAAIYFPRIRIPDPLNAGRMRDSAPSGTIAGVFARTDSTHGVWKAPAGSAAVLQGVTSLVTDVSELENGVLNPIGINALRKVPGYGNVVWGSRTLAGADSMASDWKYIPIRRLALFLERSISQGLTWAIFEPNNESLWAQIRLSLGAFLQTIFSQGAFSGSTPKDAYFVKCDQDTTTQDDIDRGIVNVLVGFAPLKPAEFVIFKIQQQAGQTSG
jgi:phage tail sheath protein FI